MQGFGGAAPKCKVVGGAAPEVQRVWEAQLPKVQGVLGAQPSGMRGLGGSAPRGSLNYAVNRGACRPGVA